ncbi:3-deoxy-D-manno-octulosonic acid transferase [Candidatus Sumerlaeota bacterium]|nr:3-deoxy-D-manno-octulosonic acid transferase [Candidatus Sumerlaeota bacterium]
MTRYDAAYLTLSPVALPYLAWRWARKRKYRQSAPGMLGAGLPCGENAKIFEKGSVWIHAVSVGEVAAACAVEPELRNVFPNLPFVVSTVTETGQEAVRKSIPGAEAHTYFPVDLSWNVRRYLNAFRPRYIIIMETEIWPNFITLARASGAEVFWINGKLSDRSYPRYRKFKGLLRPVFDSIAGFCVQTAEDARRFEALGIPPERIRVTGNCKFDLAIPRLSLEERAALRAELVIAAGSPVVVAGSTHEGEEEMIFAAWRRVLEEFRNACLILAPRHPERFGVVAELARKRGFCVRQASEPTSSGETPPPQVVILDKMGVLARTYGLGEIAIVAGSWCPTGGHNLLEAAAHAVPVIYGPNMKSQREIAHLFKSSGAGTQANGDELSGAILSFLRNPELRRIEGAKAQSVILQNQGSARRSAEALGEWLKHRPE